MIFDIIKSVVETFDLEKQDIKIVSFENYMVIKVSGTNAESFVKRYTIDKVCGGRMIEFDPRTLNKQDTMTLMRRMHAKGIPPNDMGLILDRTSIFINKNIRCGFTLPNKKLV